MTDTPLMAFVRLSAPDHCYTSDREIVDSWLSLLELKMQIPGGDLPWLVKIFREQRDELESMKLAQLPALEEEIRWILGRPNFWCGPMAHVFQAADVDIAKKAEDEQAFVIHWLLGLYLKHGAATYKKVAQDELNAARDKATQS